MFQLTAARRRLVFIHRQYGHRQNKFQLTAARRRLGGWLYDPDSGNWFQLTAARRRLVFDRFNAFCFLLVSTHSRPKAAGDKKFVHKWDMVVSTHSRPKAAGCASSTINTAP